MSGIPYYNSNYEMEPYNPPKRTPLMPLSRSSGVTNYLNRLKNIRNRQQNTRKAQLNKNVEQYKQTIKRLYRSNGTISPLNAKRLMTEIENEYPEVLKFKKNQEYMKKNKVPAWLQSMPQSAQGNYTRQSVSKSRSRRRKNRTQRK